MHAAVDDLAAIFPGDSEMARTMREHDWSSTPLGPPGGWPDALKIPLAMLLTSKFEMWLGWGDDLHFFYNDAYLPTIGMKHPVMLGRPFREVWCEVYDEVADQVARVRAGEATWNQELLLLLERSGFPEETYHSFSYSPLYDGEGGIGGLLCVVTEDTARVIARRRLETLRALGSSLAGAGDRQSVVEAVDEALAGNRRDFPFVALDLHGGDTPDAATVFSKAALSSRNSDPAGEIVTLPADVELSRGDWDHAPTKAVAIAIPGPAGRDAAGSPCSGSTPTAGTIPISSTSRGS